MPADLPATELDALYGVWDALYAGTDTTTVADPTIPTELSAAIAGQPWTVTLQADDADGTQFFWQIVQGPAGLTLTPDAAVESTADGHRNSAVLNWTPTARDAANTEIVVRVEDSRGGVALQHFIVPVEGGNSAPVVSLMDDITLTEGEFLSLPVSASDADGDPLTITLRNLPAGASFDVSISVQI